MVNAEIRSIINQTFDVLDREMKSYVVMNKYDELPDTLPSDIDIAVSDEDFTRLDQIVGVVGNRTGLVITQKIWHNYKKCAYILTPLHVKEPFRLQLDFFADFAVTSTPLLIRNEELMTRTRTYGRFTVPEYDLEFVFLFMRRIYKNDFDDEHCDILRNVLVVCPDRIENYCSQYFSHEVVNAVIFSLLNQDYDTVREKRGELWKQLRELFYCNSRGIYFVKYWADQLKRTFFRIKYPVGMKIAFLSPDGGGKSTIIQNVQKTCWGSFHYMEVKYFRPHILKNLGHYNVVNPSQKAKTNTDPHGVKPDGKIKSFVRFMFYNLDFMLGGLADKKSAIKKKLTIYDRYYYDYYVDIQRYKYGFSKKIPHIFSFLISMPDMVFVLKASPDVLYARKQESPLPELERQMEDDLHAAEKIKNAVVINTEKPVKNIVDDITSKILLYKGKETAKAMKLTVDVKTGVAKINRGGKIYLCYNTVVTIPHRYLREVA